MRYLAALIAAVLIGNLVSIVTHQEAPHGQAASIVAVHYQREPSPRPIHTRAARSHHRLAPARPAPASHSSVVPRPVRHVAPRIATAVNWDAIARCESGGNWHINTGNGYYGGLQF